jgi:hypothetical protein
VLVIVLRVLRVIGRGDRFWSCLSSLWWFWLGSSVAPVSFVLGAVGLVDQVRRRGGSGVAGRRPGGGHGRVVPGGGAGSVASAGRPLRSV